jgi:hypothetical protein
MAFLKQIDSGIQLIHEDLKDIHGIDSYTVHWEHDKQSPYVTVSFRDNLAEVRACNPDWEDQGYRDRLMTLMFLDLSTVTKGKLYYVKGLIPELAECQQPKLHTCIVINQRLLDSSFFLKNVHTDDSVVMDAGYVGLAIASKLFIEVKLPEGE